MAWTDQPSTWAGSGGRFRRRSAARWLPAIAGASSRAAPRAGATHHLQPWALGGHTSLEGLVLLCRRHHTAVHEGGFRIERARDGTVTEQDPRSLGPTQERLARVGRTVGAHTTSQAWRGERIDIGWVIDVLRGDEGAPSLATS